MNFSFLLANNNRSKAYLQTSLKSGLKPSFVILMEPDQPRLVENYSSGSGDIYRTAIVGDVQVDLYFDQMEEISETLEKFSIPTIVLNTNNVNSQEVVRAIRDLPDQHIIYSGPGGTILRPEILDQGKEFIHVHPGWLPQYKGSTTMYYSLLVDKSISCSVFLMKKSLDAGPVLLQREYKITNLGIDPDRVLDPVLRAATLRDFLENADFYLKQPQIQADGVGNTFYIIHPVLKHLAILGVNKTG